jgi:hypothetical protein
MPAEVGEGFEPEVPEENLELKVTVEIELGRESEELIIDKGPEYGPKDDYLQKELERQEQEKLSKMVPKRIP